MKRRVFLTNTGIAASAPMLINGLNLHTPSTAKLGRLLSMENDKILVLIQLQGGNDGLNTLVPMDSVDLLAKHRPNLFIPESELLVGNHGIGFHPALSGIKELSDEGRMSIVHSVGYPNQNRSHFRSTDIWTSGSSADAFDSTGWLGKYLQLEHPDYPNNFPNDGHSDPIAITMGGITSETCQGTAANFSLAIHDPFGLSPLTDTQPGNLPEGQYGEELLYIRDEISKTNAYTGVITAAANKGSNLAEYPEDNMLANQLKNVATLISGGLQTKIYVCSIGGFDTHANQIIEGNSLQGTHQDLLDFVSSGIQAFQTDLDLLGLSNRVLGLTFSEFGRQIASNQSLGTDHGTAAPLFLFGQCVAPGAVGNLPEIPEKLAPQEGVSMQIDFRDVYGTILQDWFEISPSDVKDILFPDFSPLPLIQGCGTTSVINPEEHFDFNVFPNPFMRSVEISFKSHGSGTRLSVFDALGSEVKVVFDKKWQTGSHILKVDMGDLPAGNYFFQLRSEYGQISKVAQKTRS